MYTDFKHVTKMLEQLARKTAAGLGPEWKVEALLSTAFVVHPIGFRLAVDDGIERVLLTAHVSTRPDMTAELATVTHEVDVDDDPANTVRRTVEAIRTEILPHFGREDALAGVRVLSLPLRDAGISAIAQGERGSMSITYKEERLNEVLPQDGDDGLRPLGVHITSTGNDDTRVEVRIPHLTIREAARISQALRPSLSSPMKGAEKLPEECRSQLAVEFPGMHVQHIVSDNPRFDDLVDPSGVLRIRRALHTQLVGERKEHRTWAAVWLRGATVAQAYAVLSAYAAQ